MLDIVYVEKQYKWKFLIPSETITNILFIHKYFRKRQQTLYLGGAPLWRRAQFDQINQMDKEFPLLCTCFTIWFHQFQDFFTVNGQGQDQSKTCWLDFLYNSSTRRKNVWPLLAFKVKPWPLVLDNWLLTINLDWWPLPWALDLLKCLFHLFKDVQAVSFHLTWTLTLTLTFTLGSEYHCRVKFTQ